MRAKDHVALTRCIGHYKVEKALDPYWRGGGPPEWGTIFGWKIYKRIGIL